MLWLKWIFFIVTIFFSFKAICVPGSKAREVVNLMGNRLMRKLRTFVTYSLSQLCSGFYFMFHVYHNSILNDCFHWAHSCMKLSACNNVFVISCMCGEQFATMVGEFIKKNLCVTMIAYLLYYITMLQIYVHFIVIILLQFHTRKTWRHMRVYLWKKMNETWTACLGILRQDNKDDKEITEAGLHNWIVSSFDKRMCTLSSPSSVEFSHPKRASNIACLSASMRL